jgi:hypothetical protein
MSEIKFNIPTHERFVQEQNISILELQQIFNQSNLSKIVLIRHGESNLESAKKTAIKINQNLDTDLTPEYKSYNRDWDSIENQINLTDKGVQEAESLNQLLQCLWRY